MQTTSALVTASAQTRARSSVRSTGFSQNTCFFGAADFMMRSACVSVLEHTTVAPIDASPSAPSASATCAPCNCASAAAACAFTSTIYFKRTPGSFARFAAWILPTRPAPNPATSIFIAACLPGFFYLQFEPVGKRNEQRLTKANRARERTERKRAALLHEQTGAGVSRERRKLSIGYHQRLGAVTLRRSHAEERLLAIRREADRDHHVALCHAANLLAIHPAETGQQMYALRRVLQRVDDIASDRKRASHADHVN